jgi:hypothetical protein
LLIGSAGDLLGVCAGGKRRKENERKNASGDVSLAATNGTTEVETVNELAHRMLRYCKLMLNKEP